MADENAKPRRRRWPLIWSAVVLACLLPAGIGLLVLRHYTRPQKLTSLLVEQVRSQFGLELALGGVGGFEFLPNLHLALPRPTLKSADGGAVLDAASIDVVVPWRSLWGERIEVERIRIERPTLDLDALSRWLAARPAGGAAPDVRFAVQVRGGTLLSFGKPLAQGLNLEFANAGDLAAWYAQLRDADATSPLLPPLTGSAETDTLQFGATHIEGLRVEIREAEPAAASKPSR